MNNTGTLKYAGTVQAGATDYAHCRFYGCPTLNHHESRFLVVCKLRLCSRCYAVLFPCSCITVAPLLQLLPFTAGSTCFSHAWPEAFVNSLHVLAAGVQSVCPCAGKQSSQVEHGSRQSTHDTAAWQPSGTTSGTVRTVRQTSPRQCLAVVLLVQLPGHCCTCCVHGKLDEPRTKAHSTPAHLQAQGSSPGSISGFRVRSGGGMFHAYNAFRYTIACSYIQ